MTIEIDELSASLNDLADQLDRHLVDPRNMDVHGAYGGAVRDGARPVHVAMSDEAIAKAERAGWYLSEENMVVQLDAKNVTEITLLDGTKLTRELGKPFLNPNAPTGLTGPGVLGVYPASFGPSPENRAVDTIPYFVGDGGLLHFFGITRQASDGSKPAFNGGFNEGGAFETAVKEFIEESVSTSALVLIQTVSDAAFPLVEVEGQKLLKAWEKSRTDVQLEPAEQQLLRDYHVHSHLDKGEVAYRWLVKNRPEFVADVATLFQHDKLEVFAGIVRADPRNTDTRWIATQAFASHVQYNELGDLLSKYHLGLAGGSDAASTNIHGFDAKFVLNAYASHGPILMHAFAAIIKNNPNLPETIYHQAEDLISAVATHLAQKADPVLPDVKSSSVPAEQLHL